MFQHTLDLKEEQNRSLKRLIFFFFSHGTVLYSNTPSQFQPEKNCIIAAVSVGVDSYAHFLWLLNYPYDLWGFASEYQYSSNSSLFSMYPASRDSASSISEQCGKLSDGDHSTNILFGKSPNLHRGFSLYFFFLEKHKVTESMLILLI